MCIGYVFFLIVCLLLFLPLRPFPLRCGSGLSGEVLTEAGHHWVGVDISQHMLGEGGAAYLISL